MIELKSWNDVARRKAGDQAPAGSQPLAATTMPVAPADVPDGAYLDGSCIIVKGGAAGTNAEYAQAASDQAGRPLRVVSAGFEPGTGGLYVIQLADGGPQPITSVVQADNIEPNHRDQMVELRSPQARETKPDDMPT